MADKKANGEKRFEELDPSQRLAIYRDRLATAIRQARLGPEGAVSHQNADRHARFAISVEFAVLLEQHLRDLKALTHEVSRVAAAIEKQTEVLERDFAGITEAIRDTQEV